MNARFLLAILASLSPTLTQAASIGAPTFACRAQADSKKTFEFIAKNDTAGLDRFKKSKLASGDCSNLTKGMAISVDKKDGQFMCVRPTGGLDCLWAANVAINENASQSDGNAQPSHSGGRGHGGGHGQFQSQ